MTIRSRNPLVGRAYLENDVQPIAAFFAQNPQLLALARRIGPLKPSKSIEGLVDKAGMLLSSAGARFAHPWEKDTPREPKAPYIPGCLLLARVTAKSHEPEMVEVQPKELWDIDPTSVGSQLHKLLQDANEERAPFGPDRFNIVLWVSGFFDVNLPLHAAVCDASGNAYAIFAHEDQLVSEKIELLEGALPFLRNAYVNLIGGEGAAPSARPHNPVPYAPAMEYGFAQLGRLRKALEASEEGRRTDAREAEARLLRKLKAVGDDALLRRKAAVTAKNLQIEALTARLQESERLRLEAQHSARSEVAKLRTALAAANVSATDAVTVPSTPAPTPVVDESLAHYCHTVEHQAEVIRQMKVTQLHLTTMLAEAQGQSVESVLAEVVPPRRLADIADWAAANADRVIVLKRAINHCKKATYDDEPFVYQALDMLATTYRDVKLGLADRMAFRTACEGLGLDFGGSIAECAGDEYFFNWKDRRTFMDQHIGRGVSRDPRFCFRCYFTWDASESKVIIGWLPSHLPTRAT